MLVKKDQYVFSNDILTKVSHILYDDKVISFNGIFTLSDFKGVREGLEIRTTYNTLYFRRSESLFIKDLLTSTISLALSEDIYDYDYILYKKRFHNYLGNNEHNFNQYLTLKNIDYSVADSELLYEYNLPKNYLIKALSTGCPDKEYINAKEYNTKLQMIINSLGLESEEDLRKYIINKNSSIVPKIKINYALLDLFLYCINGSYLLRSGTKVSLKALKDIPLTRVLSLLDSLNIKYQGTEDYVVIDSNLIFSLFNTEFNHCSFILNLTKAYVLYLNNKIKTLDCIYMKHNESILYLQEFLYRSQFLYTIQDNYLIKVNDFISKDDYFLIEVISVRPIENCSEFKEIS